MTCPQCGAPAQFPPGQLMFECPYCHRQFANPAAAQHAAQPQGPTFIIVHGPGGHDDDDDDDDHHHYHHPMVHPVASGMSWITWVIVCVVLTVVGGGGGFFAWFSKHSSIASSLVWDGTGPFHCDGNEQVSVSGVSAQFNAGTAVNVGGNCHFTCTDCSIKAPTAIEVGGNGSVTIVNGSVIGTEVMVDASGNARVNISGNVVASGEVKKSSNAKVSAPKPAAVASAASPAATAAPAAAAASVAAKTAAAPKASAKPAAAPKKK